jgi:bifunctional non-homologous end joining protein LigD
LTTVQDVVIGGWHPGRGQPNRLGSLLVGAHDQHGSLVYLGDVGTGFSQVALRDLQARLEPLARPDSPFHTDVPADHARTARWVEPTVVGQVVYRQIGRDGRLRHSSWRGLRPDVAPHDATIEFA